MLGDVADAHPGGAGAEHGHVQQGVDGLGGIAVAVHQFVQQVRGVLLTPDGGDAPVEVHPLLVGGYVGAGDVGGYGQVGGTLGGLLLLPLLLQHRVLQQLKVDVVAHAHHVPGLLRAQQVARAPDLQVPHGDLESGAELHVLLDGRQALGGDFRENLARAVGHVCVCPAGAAPDTAPDLVELGQPHLVRVLNDQGVHVGDVNAGLDDGGTHQDLSLPLHHLLHDGTELLLVHAAVARYHPDLLPHQAADLCGGGVDGLHPVVEIVDLAAPVDLPAHGVADHAPVMFDDVGLHRLAVLGRLLQGGHVPDAGQGHIQGPGDGGGGEGEDVHLLAHLLELLLVADAEALFLVHHQQPQVLEHHVFLEQLVGADEQVHLPGAQVVENLPGLGGGLEPAEDPDLHRKGAEAVARRGEMLLGQDGGGGQNGRLLPVQNALHHRPQGNLRLAVAHVAAKEAVHGHRLFHVLLDFRDAPQLVVGLHIVKGLLKLPLPGGVRREGEAGAALPLGIQGDEALGQIPGGGLGLGLLLVPVGSAQLVELHGLGLAVAAQAGAADVFADLVQSRGRDIQAVPPGVGDEDVVLLHAVHRHLPDAVEPSYAVGGVDNQVPYGEVRVAEELLPAALLAPAGGLLPGGGGGELALGQHRQGDLGIFRACGESPHADPYLPRPRHLSAGQVQGGGDVPLKKHPLEVPGPGGVAAQQQGPVSGRPVVVQVPGGGLDAAAVGAQLLGADGQQRSGRQGVTGGGQGFQHTYGKAVQLLQPLALAEQQGRQISVLLPGGQEGFRVLPGLPEDVFHPLAYPARLAEAQQGVGGEIVEDGGLLRSRQQLRRGQQQGGLQIFRPPLGEDIKGAQGVDLVVEKLAPDRLGHQGREHVQDAPPEGELSHSLHLVRPAVPRLRQPEGQGGRVVPLPRLQGDGGLPQKPGRAGLLEQGLGGDHHYLLFPAAQLVEGGDPVVFPLPGNYGARPDKQLPGKQLAHPAGGFPLPQQDLQISRQPPRLAFIGADHHQGPPGPDGGGPGDLGAVYAAQPGDGGGAAPGFHGGGQSLRLRNTHQCLQ